ncbi:hypothetical protein WHR41_00558 [Cladosporium halotolerans]|uniref:Uncharacterized protein n=1 Tax=Cladosporium halotolerans TaxID=1052096 RepID=A0AB34L097_9PEZI
MSWKIYVRQARKLRCSTSASPAVWDSQTRRQQSSNSAFFTKALRGSPGFTASRKHLKSLSSSRHCTEDLALFRPTATGLKASAGSRDNMFVITWDGPQNSKCYYAVSFCDSKCPPCEKTKGAVDEETHRFS